MLIIPIYLHNRKNLKIISLSLRKRRHHLEVHFHISKVALIKFKDMFPQKFHFVYRERVFCVEHLFQMTNGKTLQEELKWKLRWIFLWKILIGISKLFFWSKFIIFLLCEIGQRIFRRNISGYWQECKNYWKRVNEHIFCVFCNFSL